VRVRVDSNTFEPAGEPERVASGGMYDDFCIDDERGDAYLTVHRENRIDRVPLEPTDEPPLAIAGDRWMKARPGALRQASRVGSSMSPRTAGTQHRLQTGL
jgi:hypothetical protein